MTLKVEYPEKLLFLINEPSRYKILYGGRGGMKTESIACALIILSIRKKIRIACFREIQKSISESVYQTIVNRIEDMGLTNEFDIQATTIISKRTGAEFIFFGLRFNINSIKSLARIDIAWIEEAVNVSKTSWDKLIPTIRGRGQKVVLENIDFNKGGPFGKGTEIWISFNPELDTDETYKRFILRRDQFAPDYVTNDVGEQIRYAFVQMLSYKDNPWLPDDLKLEAKLLEHSDPDEWLHIWGGQTRQTLVGAIYAKEIKKVLLEGRRGKVEYDPSRPVHTFWDLGHDDYTSIWFVQQVGMHYNLINFFQDRLQKIAYYLTRLQELKYNYGYHYLPHDADNETLASRSIKKIVSGSYPGKVKVVPRITKKVVGIRAGRAVFDLCNFDEENTADGWQCLIRYQYDVDEEGKFSQNPKHDEYSHGCFTAETLVLTREGPKAISTLPEIGEVLTLWGWKKYQNPHLTRANARLVEVTFSDGYTVKCTPDHLFLTAANEWKSAESLEKGLLIQSGLVRQNNFSTIEFIEYINQRNILQVLKHFIETFGKMHSDQFLKDVIYTIKMKLNQIISFGTWNVYLGKNIYNLHGVHLMKEARYLNLQLMDEKEPLNGIPPKKVKNGIVKKQLKKNLGINGQEKFLTVQNVVGRLKRLIGKIVDVNIVRSNAEMLCLKSVKQLEETADVWCLTVPNCGHFSLANGAIVKNCDAFQTFALSLKPETAQKPKPRIVSENNVHSISRSSNGWMGS